VRAAWLKSLQAAVGKSCFEAADERTNAASECVSDVSMRRPFCDRSQDSHPGRRVQQAPPSPLIADGLHHHVRRSASSASIYTANRHR
jgi:hypothetical protein